MLAAGPEQGAKNRRRGQLLGSLLMRAFRGRAAVVTLRSTTLATLHSWPRCARVLCAPAPGGRCSRVRSRGLGGARDGRARTEPWPVAAVQVSRCCLGAGVLQLPAGSGAATWLATRHGWMLPCALSSSTRLASQRARMATVARSLSRNLATHCTSATCPHAPRPFCPRPPRPELHWLGLGCRANTATEP